MKRLLFAGLLATALTGCPQPTTPGFDLSLSASQLSIEQGSSGTVTLEISNKAALTDPISLTLEGAPAGVTAVFDPVSITGNSSRLTMNVGNVAPGAYSLKVNASSGAVAKEARFSLNVNAATTPGFALQFKETSLALEQGERRTVFLELTRFQNFDGPIALSFEGAPIGVTAVFNPANLAVDDDSSLVELTADNTAQLGASTLKIRGKSGTLEATAQLELTVAAPERDFELVILGEQPVVLERRQTKDFSVQVPRDEDFTADVTLTFSDLPVGVTIADATNRDGVSISPINIVASDTAPLGVATVKVTGVGESITRTATFQINVIEAPSGSFDSSFGLVTRNLSSVGELLSDGDDQIQALTLLPDGTIAVGGIAQDDQAILAQFAADGRFIKSRLLSNINEISSIAIQGDGKLIGAGRSVSTNSNVALVQTLLNSIDADAAFGNGDGQLATDFGSSESAEAIAVQSDGKIVTAGIGANGANGFDFLITRYKADPDVADKISLDSSFNGKGFTHIDFGSGGEKFDRASSIAIQPDGKIVVVGFTSISVNASNQPNGITKFAIARLNVDGTLDTSFDTDGKLTLEAEPNTTNIANSVALEDLGAGAVRITVLGITRTAGAANSSLVAQLNTDGTLNTAFGLDGQRVLNGIDGRVVLIDPDSKKLILVSTSTATEVAGGIIVTRLNKDSAQDTTFGTSGSGNTLFSQPGHTEPRAAVIQGDKILVGGFTVVNGKRDSLLVRFKR